jgi:hypothetical protein
VFVGTTLPDFVGCTLARMPQGAIALAVKHRSANSDGPGPARRGLSRTFDVPMTVSPGWDSVRHLCGASVAQTSIIPLRKTTVVCCGSAKRSNVVPRTLIMTVGVLIRYAFDCETPLFQRTAPASAVTMSSDTDRFDLKTTRSIFILAAGPILMSVSSMNEILALLSVSVRMNSSS